MVNVHLKSTREQMKTQFDKLSKPCPFAVGDQVMLWKPYRKKGLSGCFQPKWHGPWSILKFTGAKKINCKIVDCNDPTAKMNVHINQLKLVKSPQSTDKSADVMPTDTPSEPQPVIPSHSRDTEFFDYLDDFEEDDNRIQNMEPELVEPNQADEPVVQQTLPQQIDQRWVTVDESNVIQGPRTRGIRLDYRDMASGGD